jgi:hypothetical protein
MLRMETIDFLMEQSVKEYTPGPWDSGLDRRDLEAIIGLTDDELLEVLVGSELGLDILFGPPRLIGELEGQTTGMWLVDPEVIFVMEFFCTAEAVRRGLPEPSPWWTESKKTRLREPLGITTTRVPKPGRAIIEWIEREPAVYSRRSLLAAMKVLTEVETSAGASNQHFSVWEESSGDDTYYIREGTDVYVFRV